VVAGCIVIVIAIETTSKGPRLISIMGIPSIMAALPSTLIAITFILRTLLQTRVAPAP